MSDQETKEQDIERAELIEAAELKRRDTIERQRIGVELALEADRIASSKTREVLNIEQKKTVEIADEERIIALSAKRSERIDADRQVKQAEIVARRDVETTEVSKEQALEAARLERRRVIEQLEVGRVQALQEAEIAAHEEVQRARIASDRGLDEARIGRERELRKLEVNREKEVETALMDKAIVLYQKSLEHSAAQAEAENAKARATEAAERVITVRDSEIAKRRKTVEVLIAEKEAEETRIAAEAERVRAAVEAEGQKLLNEAENVLTDQARYSLFRRKLLDRIEGIVRESVKPMEKIEGIRILHVDGLGGSAMVAAAGGGRSATDEVIDSALRYRVQAPLIDSILADIGVEGRQSFEDAGPHSRSPRHAGHPQGDRTEEGERRQAGRSILRRGAACAARARRAEGASWLVSMFRPSSTPATIGCGHGCATSTVCRTGIRRSPRAASRAASPPTRSAACAISRLRNGDRIREKLLGLSDFDMFCTYSILESPMGVENYVATLRLTPVTDGDKTFLEWSAEFDCAPERETELINTIGGGVFQGGFDALKRVFGG